MTLLLAIACVQPLDKEDSAPLDTALPEEGPESDVPGWPDAECPEVVGVENLEIDWPDLFLLELEFVDGLDWPGPHRGRVQMRDCELFPCADTDAMIDTSYPYLSFDLDGTSGVGEGWRGQGSWGPDDEAARQVRGATRNILGTLSNTGLGQPVRASACLSRVRPDEVRGAVWTELEDVAWTLDGVDHPFSVAFPFVVRFQPHAARNTTVPDTGDAPDGYATAHILYDIPYDQAWPWDDITDPADRERLYERNTPYNAR